MIGCTPHVKLELIQCAGGTRVISGYINEGEQTTTKDHPYQISEGKLHFEGEAPRWGDQLISDGRRWTVSSSLTNYAFCRGVADVWAAAIPQCNVRIVDVFVKQHLLGCDARDCSRLMFKALQSAVWTNSSTKSVEAGQHFTKQQLRFYVANDAAKLVEHEDIHILYDGRSYKVNETVDLDRPMAMPYWLGDITSWQLRASADCECSTVLCNVS